MANRVAAVVVSAAAALALAAPAVAQAPFELVRAFPADRPPGNVAVGPDGRIFASIHAGFYQMDAPQVVEVTDDGLRPYPNAVWAEAIPAHDFALRDVLGLNVDRDGILWMLDGGVDGQGRLVGWNTTDEALHRVIYIGAPHTGPGVFLNDLAVDTENAAVYIADSAGAILVVDLGTGMVRRVLDGHSSVTPEPVDLDPDRRVITGANGEPVRIGINPITVDAAGEWLYYGPMSGTAIYRVRTADLRDAALLPGRLAERVERYGDKPVSDGSTIDTAGNVYITAVTADAVGITQPDGTYRELFADDSLSWPDGFAVGPDGWIYLTVNELHRAPAFNNGENGSQGAFKIVRFRPVAEAVQGR